VFCYQCEQTKDGRGCTAFGVCGKDPAVAALQDVLIHAVKGISQYAHRAGDPSRRDAEVDRFIAEALFSTVTNVDFDPARLEALIRQAAAIRDRARSVYERASGGSAAPLPGPASWAPADDQSGLVRQGEMHSILRRRERHGPLIAGLQELILYGLKGTAAYAEHAAILGRSDDEIWGGFHRSLAFLADEPTDVETLTAEGLRVGELNLRTMKLLDAAHTDRFGHPAPTAVRIEPLRGKAIVVSGHDLVDLEALLRQTEGTGIRVYTHGEMLPAHGYPGLHRFAHLAGNYGGAWQDQQREFAAFPGAILMTTNCIQRPTDAYKKRIFTSGLVAWPGVRHIADRDFRPVIDAALAAEGFAEDGPDRSITVGYGRNAVLGEASRIVDAVKAGRIRHLFLIGGCDGAKLGRNYYSEFARNVPADGVILTLACGKYRFNKLDFGKIDGIPRLLDVGQCNDAYSAIQIALALADAFDTDVNRLPLSFILSWYEQKAVAILLTLLHLGIRGIRLGPSIPAFLEPEAVRYLSEQFGLAPISTPAADLAAALG